MSSVTDYLDPTDYAEFRSGQEETLRGVHAWWKGLAHVPAEDRQRIRREIAAAVLAYERLGYSVRQHAANGDVDLFVEFPDAWDVTHADVAILKGSMSAVRARAGWGGSG